MINFELVIPAYNEGPNLQSLIERTVKAAHLSGFTDNEFQLVIVENGSTDNSCEILKALKRTNLGEWFRYIIVEKNQGYGHGIMFGLIRTVAPTIAWTHADLQCDPLDAFRGFKLLTNQADKHSLVRGTRSGRKWRDRFVTKVFQLFSFLILKMQVAEINAQPKIFPRELLTKLKNPPKTFAFDLYVLYQALKNNYAVLSIPVLLSPRKHGKSNWASGFRNRYKTIFGIIQYMIALKNSEGRV